MEYSWNQKKCAWYFTNASSFYLGLSVFVSQYSLICSIHNFNCLLLFFLLFIHQYDFWYSFFSSYWLYKNLVCTAHCVYMVGSNHTWYSFRHFFFFFFFSSSFDWFISHLSFLNWIWCTQQSKYSMLIFIFRSASSSSLLLLSLCWSWWWLMAIFDVSCVWVSQVFQTISNEPTNEKR